MKSIVALLGVALLLVEHPSARQTSDWLESYRAPSERLIRAATQDDAAWRRLSELTERFGPRLSGTPALERAIEWAAAEMRRDGLENVHTEPVQVPHWVRGHESAAIVEPQPRPLPMLGLGDSIGTPPDGVRGEVVVVHSFEELEAASAKARGRIVLFNVPFTTYSETVRFRHDGASAAARYGAIAALVRSVAPPDLQLPHTGAVIYAADAARIPAAAITTGDADAIEQLTGHNESVIVELRMEAHVEPDALSANLIGELRGRERPDEIVVVGAHIDSWDVGPGASDDGGGCIVTWEALRLMKRLHLQPRRTVRVVLWTNEENGTRGAKAYLERHRRELGRHVLMLETDGGVARPLGFGFTGPPRTRDLVLSVATLLESIGANRLLGPGGGADVDPIAQAGHIPALSLEADSSPLFVVHHTAADTADRIDPQEMAKCAAAIAVMAYVMADMPQGILRQGW